jgi:hypothetical protein
MVSPSPGADFVFFESQHRFEPSYTNSGVVIADAWIDAGRHEGRLESGFHLAGYFASAACTAATLAFR